MPPDSLPATTTTSTTQTMTQLESAPASGSVSPAKRRRAREPGEMDFADRVTAMRRRAANTDRERQRERSRTTPAPTSTPGPSSPAPLQPSLTLQPPTPSHPLSLSQSPTPTQTPSATPIPVSRPIPTPPARPPPSTPIRSNPSTPTAHPRGRPPASGRLFNPDLDPIPSRGTTLSSSPPAQRPQHPHPHSAQQARERESQRGDSQPGQRTLFDPRLHDPLRFSVLSRNAQAAGQPQTLPHAPPSSSSTTPHLLSHSPIMSSSPAVAGPSTSREISRLSNLSNSTATTASLSHPPSAHSALSTTSSLAASSTYTPASSSYTAVTPSLNSSQAGDSGVSTHTKCFNAIKLLYRKICEMEVKCEQLLQKRPGGATGEEVVVARTGNGAQQGRPNAGQTRGEHAKEFREWGLEMIRLYTDLAEMHLNLYHLALNPILPGSLDKVLAKYNLPSRLWAHIWKLLLLFATAARPLPPLYAPTHTNPPPSTSTSTSPTPASGLPSSEHVHLIINPARISAELLSMTLVWAYTFYGHLWENYCALPHEGYKVAWAEAMGDLARFRKACLETIEGWDEGVAKVEEKRVETAEKEDETGEEEEYEDEGELEEEGVYPDEDEEGEGEEEGAEEEMPEEEDWQEVDADAMDIDGASSRHAAIPSPHPPRALPTHLHTHLRAQHQHHPAPGSSNAAARVSSAGFLPNSSAHPCPRTQPQSLMPNLLLPQQPHQPQQIQLLSRPQPQQAHFLPPSIGLAAAASWPPISEPAVWRRVAQEWYWRGLAEMPGTGRLQHHLGLLADQDYGNGNGSANGDGSRVGRGKGEGETRVAYHFLKSLTTSQPHLTARESVLPLFSLERQRARAAPGASTSALFVLLHGMLYTRVELDGFAGVKARFEEQLAMEMADGLGAGEGEWVMWAVMCLAACAEYGKEEGVIRRAENRTRKQAEEEKKDQDAPDEEMDDVVEGVAALSAALETHLNPQPSLSHDEYPLPFRLALQLTFSLFAITLRNPYRRSPYNTPHINPFITTMLTYLCIIAKSRKALEIVERYVPWEELASFVRQHVAKAGDKDRHEQLLGGGILPEDWALRGMDWVTRRVYIKGFWDKQRKDREIVSGEAEVLALGFKTVGEGVEREFVREDVEVVRDGLVEDEGESLRDAWVELARKRWRRVMGASARLGRFVRGWEWEDGQGWVICAPLVDKIAAWKEGEERDRREEDERRHRRVEWVDEDMDEPMDEDMEVDDDEHVSEVVKELKARRSYLKSVISDGRPPVRRMPPPAPAPTKRTLQIMRGYTILVFDTNVLLSFLPQFEALVESLRWTVVIPLPVIAELDGLAKDHSLSGKASAAIKYLTSHVRSHSKSLKVQTSKGNYLSDLAVRSEAFDFNSFDRNMDGLVLQAAAWQAEHWVDRSALLADRSDPDADAMRPEPAEQTCRVLLLTLDRNLRLRARGRQIDVAGPTEIASILSSAD